MILACLPWTIYLLIYHPIQNITLWSMNITEVWGTCIKYNAHHHRNAMCDHLMPWCWMCDPPEIEPALENRLLTTFDGQDLVSDTSDPWSMTTRNLINPNQYWCDILKCPAHDAFLFSLSAAPCNPLNKWKTCGYTPLDDLGMLAMDNIYVTNLISYFPCDKLYLLKIASLCIKSCHSLPCTVE